MQQIQLVTKELTPSSRVLEDLLHQAPLEYFTVGWLMSNLHRRSFGVVILFLGLLATVPIGSTVPGLMLAAVAFQMIAGSCEVVFPQFIASRSLPTRYLFCIGRRGLPVLKILEQVVHPRWPLTFEAAKRLVGVMVLLLTVVLLLTPVPLSNIAPAIVIALIALTYTQEDGLLLCFALLAAVVLIGAASAAIWGAIISATFISRVW